jgi:hypothetical protein
MKYLGNAIHNHCYNCVECKVFDFNFRFLKVVVSTLY